VLLLKYKATLLSGFFFAIVNWEFFHFIGKKMTWDIFTMGEDVNDQLFQISYNYWYLTLTILFTCLILWKCYPKERKRTLMTSLSWGKIIPINISIFILVAIGIRGGLQIRSLSPKDAFSGGDYKLGVLSLNTAYGFVRSIGEKGESRKKFFKSDQEAISKIQQIRPLLSNKLNHKKMNIMVVIMESFALEYIDYANKAPFFTSMKDKGVYFPYHFSNGKRSMDAIPSLVAGLPSIIGPPIYKSVYQSNSFYALPQILDDHGYTSWFFHGGKRGTMGFAAYTKSIGFDRYFSMDDYPTMDDFDGHWGIWDDKYFPYVADELDNIQKPFFAGLFSLSSHQPFGVPEEFEERFVEGSMGIHRTIEYADFALQNFFETAKTKEWYENTLFIVTADHTHWMETKKYDNQLGWYRVPMLFYHPKMDLSGLQNNKVTQHADIMKTILDFLGIEDEKKLLFGRSLLTESQGRAIVRRGSYFNYIQKDQFVEFNPYNGKFQFYRVENEMFNFEKVPASQGDKTLLEELKALIQYGHNGLRKNKLYIQ
jgi:phosphoglycerol transferase MdoB-like AlkP superfamily enzyme